MQNKNRHREFGNTIKHSNTDITRIPEGQERKGGRNIFEELAETVSNLQKETNLDPGSTETHPPNKINPSSSTRRHTVLDMAIR